MLCLVIFPFPCCLVSPSCVLFHVLHPIMSLSHLPFLLCDSHVWCVCFCFPCGAMFICVSRVSQMFLLLSLPSMYLSPLSSFVLCQVVCSSPPCSQVLVSQFRFSPWFCFLSYFCTFVFQPKLMMALLFLNLVLSLLCLHLGLLQKLSGYSAPTRGG